MQDVSDFSILIGLLNEGDVLSIAVLEQIVNVVTGCPLDIIRREFLFITLKFVNNMTEVAAGVESAGLPLSLIIRDEIILPNLPPGVDPARVVIWDVYGECLFVNLLILDPLDFLLENSTNTTVLNGTSGARWLNTTSQQIAVSLFDHLSNRSSGVDTSVNLTIIFDQGFINTTRTTSPTHDTNVSPSSSSTPSSSPLVTITVSPIASGTVNPTFRTPVTSTPSGASMLSATKMHVLLYANVIIVSWFVL